MDMARIKINRKKQSQPERMVGICLSEEVLASLTNPH